MATPADVELWIDAHNRSLQEHIRPNESGYGVCFMLAPGGCLYLHTTQDGAILLDVDEEADWVTPLIAAATGATPPKGRLWVLPDDKLVQLVFGLNTLVDATILVVGHDFGSKLARHSRPY
nr:hypothetical protein [Massilia sp. TS11]